jgi:hypothetical protein
MTAPPPARRHGTITIVRWRSTSTAAAGTGYTTFWNNTGGQQRKRDVGHDRHAKAANLSQLTVTISGGVHAATTMATAGSITATTAAQAC